MTLVSRRSVAVYLALFALAAFLAAPLTRILPLAYAASGCAAGAPAGTFIATCVSDLFGDYERGAYYYGLEAEAIANLRRAEVLFLGSSRAQFAFSTDEVRSYFAARGVPYYVFGFARGDSRLAGTLISKYGVKPKVVIVAADPFFVPASNEMVWLPDAEMAPWDRASRWFDYRVKRAAQAFAPRLCETSGLVCAAASRVIHRASRDGMWEWRGHFRPEEEGNIPVPAATALEPTDEARQQASAAREFLARVGVRADCLVLTATPDVQYLPILNERFVTDLARDLGAVAIVPRLDGLTTIDTTHLTWSSAQRWSAAFLAQVGPVLRRCLY